MTYALKTKLAYLEQRKYTDMLYNVIVTNTRLLVTVLRHGLGDDDTKGNGHRG